MNVCIIINTEKKSLLFLETSALDSTNVEAAFTTVLAGNIYLYFFFYTCFMCFYIADINEYHFSSPFLFPTLCEYLL